MVKGSIVWGQLASIQLEIGTPPYTHPSRSGYAFSTQIACPRTQPCGTNPGFRQVMAFPSTATKADQPRSSAAPQSSQCRTQASTKPVAEQCICPQCGTGLGRSAIAALRWRSRHCLPDGGGAHDSTFRLPLRSIGETIPASSMDSSNRAARL